MLLACKKPLDVENARESFLELCRCLKEFGVKDLSDGRPLERFEMAWALLHLFPDFIKEVKEEDWEVVKDLLQKLSDIRFKRGGFRAKHGIFEFKSLMVSILWRTNKRNNVLNNIWIF